MRLKIEDVLGAVNLSMEALTDDLVPAILGDEGGFSIDYMALEDGLLFTWSWDHLGDLKHYEAIGIRVGDTEEIFKSRVDAYFFALCIMLANL